MWRVTVAALFLSLCPAAALGQDAGISSQAAAEDVEVDPRTGQRFRWTRPEEPLRRGALPVPGWVALAGGSLVAAGAVAALLWRTRRRRR